MYSPVLFAARSTKGITRLSPTERAAIKLPDEVKEVLIAPAAALRRLEPAALRILLGDALWDSCEKISVFCSLLFLYMVFNFLYNLYKFC